MKDNGFFKLFFRAFIPTFIILSLLGTLLVIGLIGPDTKKEAPVQSSSNTSFEGKPKEDFYTSFATIISKNSTITHFVITQITSQQVSVFTLPPNVIISDKTAEVLYKTLSVKDFKDLLSEYTEAKINYIISLSDTDLVLLSQEIGGSVVNIPELMQQTDRKNNLYIKFKPGKQYIQGIALLDYLSYTKWDIDTTFTNASKIIASTIEQNKSNFSEDVSQKIFTLISKCEYTDFSYADFCLVKQDLLSVIQKTDKVEYIPCKTVIKDNKLYLLENCRIGIKN